MADYASESGHWYERDGTPAYTVIGANGIERPTTLRDARKKDLVPGQGTIVRCAAVPPLVAWMIDQNILAALTLPKMDGEAEASWLKRVKADARAQAEKAAARGTEIHGAIEGHFKNKAPADGLWPWVEAVLQELEHEVGLQIWKAEKSYANRFGYGCKIDLHSESWVIDYKGKDDEKREELSLWDEHYMQLAACRRAANLPRARCAIVFFGRQTPWARFMEAEERDLIRGWDMFESLLTYWQAKNRIER